MSRFTVVSSSALAATRLACSMYKEIRIFALLRNVQEQIAVLAKESSKRTTAMTKHIDEVAAMKCDRNSRRRYKIVERKAVGTVPYPAALNVSPRCLHFFVLESSLFFAESSSLILI